MQDFSTLDLLQTRGGRKTIRVDKSADDRTREIRQPKTQCSAATLPMPRALEAVLRTYIQHWKPNPGGILLRRGTGCDRVRGRT